jgi:cell division septal protein FtsQ
VFLLTVLCAGAYVASSLLFKIESITVSGNVRFESDYIIRLSGLNIGDNLLFLDTKGAQDSISQNPYITAKITRKLPNQIVINGYRAQRMCSNRNKNGICDNGY